jgi:hypothetical protein
MKSGPYYNEGFNYDWSHEEAEAYAARYGDRDEHGNYIATVERRAEWQSESNKIAHWILAKHPKMQRKMTMFAVRCPTKGCLLGRVYDVPLNRHGGVRYVWVGVTSARIRKAAILNWAWDGTRGEKDFIHAGCQHGNGQVNLGWLMYGVEALEEWHRPRPDDWMDNYPPEIVRGYKGRTFIPETGLWESWS